MLDIIVIGWLVLILTCLPCLSWHLLLSPESSSLEIRSFYITQIGNIVGTDIYKFPYVFSFLPKFSIPDFCPGAANIYIQIWDTGACDAGPELESSK